MQRRFLQAGGFILDAHSGAPLEGAKVTIFQQNSEGYYNQAGVTYTEKNGSFTIPNDNQRSSVLHAKYEEYELLGHSGYAYARGEQGEYERTVFFTDRAIYRPGQMIHFKVPAIKSNQDNDTYDFLPNTKLTILFKDYNYQEVEHLDLVTNAFGSASGTFTAPSGQLASDQPVKVTLGDMEIVPETTEAGTGSYEKKFIREEVLSDYGQVTVEKLDEGIPWGSPHWQYLEDMSKVTPHDTPLQLEKRLYVGRQSTEGPVIEPVQGNLAVGDKIIVRIVLRVDRDMEYVHMKDYRGSGTEPVNVLSHYKYQDGLHIMNPQAATHFFIDYLPKGTYVFEYPLRIQHKGEYQMGMASIQCMYAPEFNSHSASESITVQ